MKRSKTKFFSKKFLLGSLLWVSAFWILGMSSTTQAWIFGDILAFQMSLKSVVQMHSIVHFWVWWNNFWWSFLWSQNMVTLDTPVVVEADGDMRCCRQQMQWLYYNSQRWDRLFPLVQDGSNYLLAWWLYTQCSKITNASQCTAHIWDEDDQTDVYGIYWTINHSTRFNFLWGKDYHLIAWVNYNMNENRMWHGLKCNFQLINNVPMGYIYDSHWHVWLVWAEITWTEGEISDFHKVIWKLLDDGKCINQIFKYDWEDIDFCVENPSWGGCTTHPCVTIDGVQVCTDASHVQIWDGGEIDIAAIWLRWTLWATTDIWDWAEWSSFDVTKLVKTETSVADVVNTANKNAEQYCRNKWKDGNAIINSDVTCIDFSLGGGNLKELSANELYGKTLIVKNWDVKLTTYATDGNVKPINLFIDKWNLYLKFTNDTDKQNLPVDTLLSFSQEWYIANSCDTGKLTIQRELPQEQRVKIWTDPDTGEDIYNKYEEVESEDVIDLCNKAAYLKWNFIINGLLLAWDWVDSVIPLNSKLYIHWKLISFNSVTDTTLSRIRAIQSVLESRGDLPEINTWAIELASSFEWSCNQWWIWSDGTWCNGDWGQNSFNFKKLWIVDMTFKTSELWGGVNLFK